MPTNIDAVSIEYMEHSMQMDWLFLAANILIGLISIVVLTGVFIVNFCEGVSRVCQHLSRISSCLHVIGNNSDKLHSIAMNVQRMVELTRDDPYIDAGSLRHYFKNKNDPEGLMLVEAIDKQIDAKVPRKRKTNAIG